MLSERWMAIAAAGLVCFGALTPPATAAPSAELTPPADAEVAQGEMHLNLGEQRVISAEGVRSYSEATRGIVDIKLTRDAKQFVLVANSPGATSILFLLNNGTDRHLRVVVTDPDAKQPVPGTLSVSRVENIRLDFYFVGLDRSYGHRLGLGYPTVIQGGTFGTSYDFLTRSFTSATAVVEDQALLRLDIAQSTGWAKVLRQAAVITQNGQPAQFSGGGEVNVAVSGGMASTIQSITYGSNIQVLPRFDRESGRIEVELEAEVADLADDRGTGIPARTKSTLKTMVNLTLGQVIVVGGLSSSSEMHAKSGLPFLSQIPVLGALFRTNGTEQSRTESIVFIVPSVLDSPNDEARRQLGAALEGYEKFRGDKATIGNLRRQGDAP